MTHKLIPILCLGWLLTPAPADPVHPEWWSEARAQQPVAPAVHKAPEALAIDGDLADWNGTPALPLGLSHQAGFNRNWRGRGDLSATVRFAATDSALLLAVDAQDDRVVVAPGGDRYKGDLVRLYVAASSTTPSRAVALLPAWSHDGVDEAPLAADADRREGLPGSVLRWQTTERGYRLEAAIPWADLPGGVATIGQSRGLAIELNDWDNEARSTLAWPSELRPVTPAPAAAVTADDPPKAAPPYRPARLGELRVIDHFELAQAGPFLPALLPIGAERTYYNGGEDVRVIGLTGLGLGEAAKVDVFAVDAAGAVVRLSRGETTGEGAVEAVIWSWTLPYDFAKSLLLAAVLDEPGLGEARIYGYLESVGAAWQAWLDRAKAMRERMMAVATAPGSDARRRRMIGTVLINLEDKQESQAGWSGWLARDDLERLDGDLDGFEAQFAAARRGDDPFAARTGTLLRGYVSEIDDTLQHYSVSVPDTWKPGQRLPLVISLHGYGFGRFLGHPAPSYPDAIAVSCFGRGNGDYKLWCERDIIAVLDAMLEDYNVDPNRIYCTGGSMGGTGSWQMATMYPDRFAAIGPTAGNANHHVWEQVWGWGQRGTTFMSPFREWLQSTTSAWTYAENLQHVGVYCLHGTQDVIVPVGHARTMTERLRNLGYDVVYEEFPDVGHGGFPGSAGQRQKNYLFSRSRDPYPRHVVYKSSWPRYPGAYWAYLERFRQVGRDATIDARIDGQRITVRTSNLERFRLQLNEHLLDPQQPIDVRVDDTPAYRGPLPEGGVVRLGFDGSAWGPASPPSGLEKNPEVGGPVEHAFMSRFLLVCGTSGDPRENEVNRRMTEQCAEKWRRWGRDQRARVKLDSEVTDQDIADSNLICFGSAASNRIVRRVNDRLPVRFVDNGIQAGNEVFRGPDVGMKLCYPNPLNPRRYVCVFGGVTWQGTYDINGRFGNWFDWGVYDDRDWFDFTVFDAHSQSPETHLLVGYFDQDWQLDHGLLFRGDPAMRRATRPRRPPDPFGGIPDADEVYLSELTPTAISMEKGVLGYDHSFAGNPLTLGRMRFDRGLGVHPQAEVAYDLDGRFQTFEAWAGVDLEGADSVSKAREEAERVAFQVYGDGRLLSDTGEMRWNSPPRHLVANVEGVHQLTLTARALDGRKWLFGDADWGLARVTRKPTTAPAATTVATVADRMGLEGEWVLDEFDVGDGVAHGAEQALPATTDRRVSLPGSLAASLAARGVLPDPYADDHLAQAADLAKREWWLYRRVDLPSAWDGRRVRLELSGVTQQAEVWVNGSYAGKVAGPYAAGELELPALRYGRPNLLAIRLLAGAAPWTNVRDFRLPSREEAVGAGVDYGLDGGGTAIAVGIAGKLALRATGPVRLAAPRIATELPDTLAIGSAARVPCAVVIHTSAVNDTREPRAVTVRGELEALDGQDPAVPFERALRLDPGETAPLAIRVELPAARLWWPAGRGAQPRYRCHLEVRDGQTRADETETTFGLRRIELPDGDGGRLTVNGAPVPLYVAELRPADRLRGASRTRLEGLLRGALATGFTAVRAGGGPPEPELEALCDSLGVLLIQELPLTGDLGRASPEAVAAAVTGLVTADRNHPALLAYALGHDVPATAAAAERLKTAQDLLARLAPETPRIDVTDSTPGATRWTWSVATGTYERRAWNLPVGQVRLSTAPPASLAFLNRDRLPLDEREAPWPLTSFWRLHGGRDDDLDAARAWLGPVHDDDGLQALLTRWQAESARRQVAPAVAAGDAVCVEALDESWPRAGGALFDHDGTPRPARETVRRLLRPAVVALPTALALRPGELLQVPVQLTGAESASAVGVKSVSVRVQDLGGHLWQSVQEDVAPAADLRQPLAKLDWEVDETVPPGAYLLVAEAPGSGLEADVTPLAVYPPLGVANARVAGLAAEPPRCAGVSWVAPDRVDDAVDAIYLGAGEAPAPAAAEAVRQRVEAGAGLVIDGPPEWLAQSPLADLLPSRPVAGPLEPATEPVRPEVVMADHPALAGLRGALPEGLPGDWQKLADGAETLVRYGPDRPLLVEGRYGKGRVLLVQAPPEYRRRLALWDGRERLYTGLLAYAAKLPFGDTKRLLAAPDQAPLAALRDLAPGPARVTVTTAPLSPSPERPERREVKVRNDGPTPMPMVTLRLADLPPGLTAEWTATAFPLLPGEERTTTVTVRTLRRGRSTGTAHLVVAGWGVQPASTDLPVDTGP